MALQSIRDSMMRYSSATCSCNNRLRRLAISAASVSKLKCLWRRNTTVALSFCGQQRRNSSNSPAMRQSFLWQYLRLSSSSFPYPSQHLQSRSFSSRRKNNNNNQRQRNSFQLDALPFSISPEEAMAEFQRWATEEQGLKYLLRSNDIRIGASYVPVWSFGVNVKFHLTMPYNTNGQRQYDWKPHPFALPYHNQSVVHLPDLAVYAGHSYRRSLVNPIHDTALVFMGDKTIPFGTWMLRDMEMVTNNNGERQQHRIEVIPDPWNATKGRAFTVLREELQTLAEQDVPLSSAGGATAKVEVQTELLSSRRVYMPTWVIDYSILGADYRAFCSGCDAGAKVSGVSHQVFTSSAQEVYQGSTRIFSQIMAVARTGFSGAMGGRGRNLGSIVAIALNVFGNMATRILARINLPLFGLVGGAFIGFRKLIQPWMDNRSGSMDWERQREHEAIMKDDGLDAHADDFVDGGSARQYFQTNRKMILQQLSGEKVHQKGEFDWYKDWEEWSRRQWDRQQKEQQDPYHQQQQQQRVQRPRQGETKTDYSWDFDPSDPYSVLGIRRGVNKSKVSASFRKEMLKHHPDVQVGASASERARSVERSKLITEAYRIIKTEMK